MTVDPHAGQWIAPRPAPWFAHDEPSDNDDNDEGQPA